MENILDIMEHFLDGVKNTVIYFSSLIHKAFVLLDSVLTNTILKFMIPLIRNSGFPVFSTFLVILLLQVVLLPLYILINQTHVLQASKKRLFSVFVSLMSVILLTRWICIKSKDMILISENITWSVWYRFLIILMTIIYFFYIRSHYDPYFKERLQKNSNLYYSELLIPFLIFTYGTYSEPIFDITCILPIFIMDSIVKIFTQKHSLLKEKSV